MIAVTCNDVGATLKGGSGARGYPDPSDGNGHSLIVTMCMATGQGGAEIGADIAPTLNCNHEAPIAFAEKQERSRESTMAVRRLTPRECEALQGFPDDYTLVPNRGKPAADGPRYKALGNSMAVPVMRWIGERIQMVSDATNRAREAVQRRH